MEAIGTAQIPQASDARPKLQVWTCIDDRNESIRRHIEDANPTSIETFGVAGFFGVPISFKPIDGRDAMTLAPVGNIPDSLIVEQPHPEDVGVVETWLRRRKLLAKAALWWENVSFIPVLSLVSSACFAPIAVGRLMLMSFAPNAIPSMTSVFRQKFLPPGRTTYESPFPPQTRCPTSRHHLH